MKRKFILMSVSLLFLLGCPHTREEFIYGINTMPDGNFTPLLASSDYDREIVSLMFNSLVELGASQDILPGLAEDWAFSDGNKKLTLNLRKGVQWHDGTEFTAEDVIFTLTAISNKDLASQNYGYFTGVVGQEAYREGEAEMIAGLTAPDPHTVVIKYEEADSVVLPRLSFIRIAQAGQWSGMALNDFATSKQVKEPIGTGPYRLKNFKPDSYINLEANPDYFKGAPKIQRFTVSFSKENALQSEMLAGGIHLQRSSNWDASVIGAYAEAGKSVYRYFFPFVRFIGLDLSLPQFRDYRIRQAFMHAINRQALIEAVQNGEGAPVNSAIPGTYLKDPLSESYGYDVERARQLLEQAEGWSYGVDNTSARYREEPVSLTLYAGGQGNSIYDMLLPSIQQDFKRIGIYLKVENLNWTNFYDGVRKQAGDSAHKPRYEMFIMGSDLGLLPGLEGPSKFVSNAEYNYTNYSNEEVDELYRAASATADPAEQYRAYQKIAEITNRELPWIFLYRWALAYIADHRLQGIAPNTNQGVFYNVEDWTFEAD